MSLITTAVISIQILSTLITIRCINLTYYDEDYAEYFTNYPKVDKTQTSYNAALYPLWINTTAEAFQSGVDVDMVYREFCISKKLPEVYFINYNNVEPIFGLEIAEELIRNYSFVAINFETLCREIVDTNARAQIKHYYQQGFHPHLITNGEQGDQGKKKESKMDDTNKQIFKITGRKQSEENELGGEMKLEEAIDGEDEKEAEAELILQQQLGDELGKKVDLEKPLTVSKAEAGGKPQETRPIGINVSALDRQNIESLEKALRGINDTEIDDILMVFKRMKKNPLMQKTLASTNIIALMKRVKYDPRTAPTLLEGQTVNVRIGIHVQSISNFQLTTMDYDMDLWLRMSWRDPRLAHGLSTPILITEESFLRRIWRPDAFFVNSVDSLFHRVTYLNFYMYVFAEGEVFFESRFYLKPKSQLVLCKYPHDSQLIYLRISSIAYTNNTVHFRWFSRKNDAIYINRNVQLRELYITGVENSNCGSRRKTGNFTCIEARFLMKRNLGYYLAQTYVPTATCVLFSWISVWLPEEFVEGRVFVALTVFLTLSAESNAAKETLPKVSYVKAIDIWFGFTAMFVFSTMLQALFVISLEHMSRKTKKIVEEQNDSLSVYKATKLLLDSKRYHKWGRGLDTFFKVMYPIILIIFLFVYYFVITEGEENKCLRGSEMDDNYMSSY